MVDSCPKYLGYHIVQVTGFCMGNYEHTAYNFLCKLHTSLHFFVHPQLMDNEVYKQHNWFKFVSTLCSAIAYHDSLQGFTGDIFSLNLFSKVNFGSPSKILLIKSQ